MALLNSTSRRYSEIRFSSTQVIALPVTKTPCYLYSDCDTSLLRRTQVGHICFYATRGMGGVKCSRVESYVVENIWVELSKVGISKQ